MGYRSGVFAPELTHQCTGAPFGYLLTDSGVGIILPRHRIQIAKTAIRRAKRRAGVQTGLALPATNYSLS